MIFINCINTIKPKDWPRNNRESKLEEIYNYLNIYLVNPTYENKQNLLSILDLNNINSMFSYSDIKVRKYEVAIINCLYELSYMYNIVRLKTFIYRYIEVQCVTLNTISNMSVQIDANINLFYNLYPVLRIFFFSFFEFNENKNSKLKFSYYLINKTKSLYDDYEDIACYAYNRLLYDLSIVCYNKTNYLKFNRNELYELFEFQASLNKSVKNDIFNTCLKGILKMTISNYILKSRNDYKLNYIYKCISDDSLDNALNNGQVWMKRVDKLNDEREQSAFKELFNNKSWLKQDWSKNVHINLFDPSFSFVCSFSKENPTKEMKEEYGRNILGYKSDQIKDEISEHIINNQIFDVVYSYDVLYNINEIKKEINYLCDIINLYDMDDTKKIKFFNEILKYWYLSFKDEKWEHEKERRYQVFNKEGINEDFLKIESNLYKYPDFIFTDNKKFKDVFYLNKIHKFHHGSFFVCNGCSNVVYDLYKTKCDICNNMLTKMF